MYKFYIKTPQCEVLDGDVIQIRQDITNMPYPVYTVKWIQYP